MASCSRWDLKIDGWAEAFLTDGEMIQPIRTRPAPKLIVFGATGLVGNACVEAARRRGFRVQAVGGGRLPGADGLDRGLQIDVTDREAVERYILEEWPDAVINAAALSNPADVDANPDLAQKVNVEFPGQLGLLTRHLGSRLIHFSTDMVFNGRRGDYRSTDEPDPQGRYGETKLAAEEAVLEANPNDPVILRITIVTGTSPTGRRSVHEKLLYALRDGKRSRLFTDEIRQPCSAVSVAEATVELLERPELHGIFHWAGAERLSRYEMGARIFEHFGIDPGEWIEPCRMGDDPVHRGRPADLTLNLHPLVGKLRTRPAAFSEQLAEMRPPGELYRWLRDLRA